MRGEWGTSPLPPIMVGLPAQMSKQQLGQRGRVDTAVTKNGYFNLDVKKIWRVTAATSSVALVTEPAVNPVCGPVDGGVF